MKKSINTVNQSVTFTFTDGLESIILSASKVSDECRTYAMLHGFAARIGDNAALSRKGADGQVLTITEEMRRAEVLALTTYYEGGAKEWTTRAAAGPKINPAIAAIATKRGCTYDEANAWFNEKLLAELNAE